VHWNANLEVAVIEHHEDNNIVPMAILRARKDIEKDTEILVIVVPVWLLLHNSVVIVKTLDNGKFKLALNLIDFAFITS